MGVWELLTPGRCLACVNTDADGLCPACKKHLDALFDPHAFRPIGGSGYADSMFTLFHYDVALPRILIFDLKSFGYKDNLTLFASYLEKAASHEDFPKDFDLVTFCPRAVFTRHARGFDQAELLAREAARITDRPMETLLSRTGMPRTQHKLSRDRRRKNVENTFLGERKLHGENILLIDDVVTTGATASEAARTLKKAGAMRVVVLCLAHG